MASTLSTSNPNSLSLSQLAAASVPLSLLRSGQLLAITPDSQGGLLLDKGFYTDLVLPGSAVGGVFDLNCKAIRVIGTVRFYAPESRSDRTIAYQKRMASQNLLKQIVSEPAPLSRAHRIIYFLTRKFGSEEMQQMPMEWIAKLVGVMPKTVRLFWHRHQLATAKKLEDRSTQLQAVSTC